MHKQIAGQKKYSLSLSVSVSRSLFLSLSLKTFPYHACQSLRRQEVHAVGLGESVLVCKQDFIKVGNPDQQPANNIANTMTKDGGAFHNLVEEENRV